MGIDITKKATIEVSADRVWSILADEFDTVGEWARGVASSAPKIDVAVPAGAAVGGRVCEVPGFGTVDETFTRFDPEKRSYDFAATASKIPGFVRNLTNHTSVTALGPDRSEVQLRITADTRGLRGAMVSPAMTHKLGGGIGEILEDLKVFAESGQVSDSKKQSLATAGR